MVKLKKILTIFIFILIPIISKAQEVYTANPSVFHRLLLGDFYSQNNISSIIQDKTGFMWFGTKAGLIKYDGYTFTKLQNVPEDKSSLSNNSINIVFQDSYSNIWIGTEEGVNRYNYGTQNFSRFQIPSNESENVNRIKSITQDLSGNIWIGTQKGLYEFVVSNENFSKISYEKTQQINSLFTDKSGMIWAGTEQGDLLKISPSEKTINKFSVEYSDTNPKIKSITAIFEDSKNNLWVGTFNGLCKFDRQSNKFIHISLLNAKPINLLSAKNQNPKEFLIRSIVEDFQGNLWIASQHGLFLLTNSNELAYFTTIENDNKSLSDNHVISLSVDRTGILWIGTYGYGVNKLYPELQKFSRLSSEIFGSNHINVRSIRAIYENNLSDLWIGGYNGLDKINRKLNSVSHFLEKKSFYSMLPDPDRPDEILWLGQDVGGFCKYDIKSDRLTEYKIVNPGLIKGEIVYSIISSKDGFLWIGTEQGLNKFDRKSEMSTVYFNDPKNPNSLSSNKINVITEDKFGFLWIGTDIGLNVLNPINNEVKRYLNNSKGLSYNVILSIHEDEYGQIWVGTGGGGLNKFARETGKFYTYSNKNGLMDNVIYSILSDEVGDIWLSTNYGISKFNVKENRFINFDEKYGLQSNEFNHGASFKSKTGEMFFGGVKGFNSFYPNKINEIETVPPIAITDFKIFNQSVITGKLPNGRTILQKPISESNEIQLSYLDNAFSFEFASLEYFNTGKTKYAYKMEGLDKDWNYVDNRRFVAFNSIPSGEYVFKVKAANNEGIWNNGTQITIIITPPFWETWWFYLLIFCVVASILYFLYRYRINQLLKIENLRVKLASDLHDDIGATLSKISMQADIIKHGIDSDNTEKNLSRISELSVKAIGTMRDIVWSIDSRNDDFKNIIVKMKDEAYSILGSKNISVQFEHSSVNLDLKLSFEIRENLYFIFKESINNIYKHSNASQVNVKLSLENGFLKMEIWDNGNNCILKNEHSGQGSKNMKMRVERIGGKFSKEVEIGYKVTFSGIKIK